MKRYRQKPVVIEAQEIKDSDFDKDHPNDDLVSGVTYDPVRRCVFVAGQSGGVGDFIIKDANGSLDICWPQTFNELYEEIT